MEGTGRSGADDTLWQQGLAVVAGGHRLAAAAPRAAARDLDGAASRRIEDRKTWHESGRAHGALRNGLDGRVLRHPAYREGPQRPHRQRLSRRQSLVSISGSQVARALSCMLPSAILDTQSVPLGCLFLRDWSIESMVHYCMIV